MSQFPTDPPPLPVVPLPVEPIAYQRAAMYRRPGVIAGIGVTSIVIASLSILAGISAGFMSFGLIMAASMPTTVPMTVTATSATTTTSATAVNTGGTPERIVFDGLGISDRQQVAAGLMRVRSLSAPQLLQLDELLAEHGKMIVPTLMPPEAMARDVSDSRHMSYGDYFVLGEGRLEVSPDRAVFFPIAGQPPYRSNAFVLGTVGSSPGAVGLTEDQIRSTLRTINEINGGKIKGAQLKTISELLQSPSQQIVVPTTDGTDPAWEITSVSTASDGTLSIATKYGDTTAAASWDATGRTVRTSVASNSVQSFTTPKISRASGVVSMSLIVIQLLLAVYLLVAGILTLRSSPAGRKLHWIYVGLKIPLALASGAVAVWMWTSLLNSIPSSAGGPTAASVSTAMGLGASLPMLLSLIYPITLIFLLKSRKVRIFYDLRPD